MIAVVALEPDGTVGEADPVLLKCVVLGFFYLPNETKILINKLSLLSAVYVGSHGLLYAYLTEL